MLARLAEDEALLIEAILTDGSRLSVTAFRYHGPDMVIIDGQDSRGRPAMLCTQLGSVSDPLHGREEPWIAAGAEGARPGLRAP